MFHYYIIKHNYTTVIAERLQNHGNSLNSRIQHYVIEMDNLKGLTIFLEYYLFIMTVNQYALYSSNVTFVNLYKSKYLIN